MAEGNGATAPITRTSIVYLDAVGAPCGLRDAIALRITGADGTLTFNPTHDSEVRMFGLFGMMTLAKSVARTANAPIAEIKARFAKVGPAGWGDEKPQRAKRVARDPLTELVEIVRIVKGNAGQPFAEEAFRKKCEDPKFKRAARKVPEVAAEFAKRKVAAVPESGLGAL